MDKIQCEVIAKKVLAEDIVGIEIRATSGVLPQWDSGSHVSVFLPRGMIRQYSLCGAPSLKNETYQLGILRDPHSRGGSEYIASHLQIGDRIEITPPMNHFRLKTDGERYFLFAGGIGITPIFSHAFAVSKLGKRFDLHYCTRSPQKMALQEELKNLGKIPGADVNFHFDNGPEEQKLALDRILGSVKKNDYILVCGPDGFMQWIFSGCKKAGIAETQIISESFTPSADAHLPKESDGGFEVQIQSTGKVFHVNSDESIADVLMKNGVDVALSCSAGICGICVTQYVSGEVVHNDSVLSEEDREHEMTICCSRAKGRVILKM